MRTAVNRQKPRGVAGPPDSQADEHEEAAAEFGQDDEAQGPRIDAARAEMRRGAVVPRSEGSARGPARAARFTSW
jgi:hypothetical protein